MRGARGTSARPGARSAQSAGGERPLTPEQRDALRRAYFVVLSQHPATARLGVGVERVEAHVRAAWGGRKRAKLDVERLHLADVAVAAACVEGLREAWAMVIGDHEPHLIRVAEPHEGSTAAVVTVRRMFIEMRRDSAGGGLRGLSLARYAGDRPIDAWLIERLMGRLAIAAAIRRAEVGRQRADTIHRLRVALDLLGNERMSVQALAASLAQTSADLFRAASAERQLAGGCVEDLHG